MTLIELQSHSTLSDGQLAPADVVDEAAKAGVTTLALSDHDAVAGVPEATEAGARAGGRDRAGDRDVLRPRVRRRPAYLRLLDRPGEDRAGLRARPAGTARRGPRRSSRTCAASASTSPSRTRSARPAAPTRSAAPTSPSAAGATRRPRPVLRGVPGPRRQGLRPAPLARRRAGDRADPRGRRRRRHRPPLLGHLRPGRGRGPDPLARRRRGRDLLPDPHRGADRAPADLCAELDLVPTASSDYHGPTHKTFAAFGAYDTYGLGEPQVPQRAFPLNEFAVLRPIGGISANSFACAIPSPGRRHTSGRTTRTSPAGRSWRGSPRRSGSGGSRCPAAAPRSHLGSSADGFPTAAGRAT